MNSTLSAGASRRDITPNIGAELYGYYPGLVSTSIHDRLDLTVLALKEGEEKALFCVMTLGDIHNSLYEELSEEISSEFGINKKHIILSCTHTHCGPNTSGEVGWGEIDREYVDEILTPALLSACEEALSGLQPAEIAAGTTKSEVGINRRQQLENGIVSLGQNPHGAFDPEMTFIALRNAENKEGIINLIHYGCHGTACGAIPVISRDWSGIMTDRTEKDSGTLTAFINGCVGDVGPRLSNGGTVGDVEYMENLGGLAALDAHRARMNMEEYHQVHLEIKTDTVSLPNRPLPALDEITKRLGEISDPEKLVNSQMLEYNHLLEMKEYLLKEEKDEYFRFDTVFIKLGGVLLMPVPFEIFAETTLRLREYIPEVPHTLILSNSNGYNCYLPCQSQICLGGYEVDCFKNTTVPGLADDADQHLINEYLRIYRS